MCLLTVLNVNIVNKQVLNKPGDVLYTFLFDDSFVWNEKL